MGILASVLSLALIAADEPSLPRLTAPEAAKTPDVAKPRIAANPEANVVWHLTLADAIRIGLENSPVVRMVPDDSKIVISRVDRDASASKFKADLLAHVRSIEQTYWALSMCQANLWTCETAVKLGEEVLRREREREELEEGRATSADIAEAEQHLENFKLNLVTATSDAIKTERQLRNILGLPPVDALRIVPGTAPNDAKIAPNWEACVELMKVSEPEIVEQRYRSGVARLKAALEAEDPATTAEQKAAGRKDVEAKEAELAQTLQRSTHELARFFLEVDANHKQYQTARSLREASEKRFQAQRAFYDEGRITPDRLLDAVSQYTHAIAQESLFLSSYNTSIASLEEAKGTLLATRGITVADEPSPKPDQPRDAEVAPVRFDAAPPAPEAPARPQSGTKTTYKLRAKFGLLKVLDVEFEVCPGSK